MISVYDIKPRFQQLLMPLLKLLHRNGITPNQITIAALILSLFTGIGLWMSPEFRFGLLWVPIGLFLRMALNALDGMMARTYNLQSKTGAMLNEVGDVISDLFIFFPLIILPGHTPWVIAAFLGLTVFNEFCGLLPQALGGKRRYDGPFGKSDRALFIGIWCLLLWLEVGVVSFSAYIFGGACLLLVLSSILRLKNGLKVDETL